MHYISGDIEGMSGFGCAAGAPSHQELLTRHLAAAAEGMHEGGESFIRLRTWHGRPELPDYVEVVNGNRTEDFDLPGLTSEFAGLALVGFHGSAGSAFGHAYRFTHMMLNGSRIGEIAIQVLLAATRGVPTVFLAGNQAAIDEVLVWSPETVAVRTRPGLAGDEGPLDEKVLHAIRQGARRAVELKGAVAPPRIPEPLVFSAPMPSESAARMAETLPFDVRRDGKLVTIESADFRSVYRFLLELFNACDKARQNEES